MSFPLVEMRNITKEFSGVKVLQNVNFKVEKGEIHCLVGENGAGKSTLMKILSGVYPYGEYSGDILLNGEAQKFSGVSDSKDAGIAIIYQELELIPEMTVYDNIFLGNEIAKGLTVDVDEAIKRAREMLDKVGFKLSPSVKVKDLSVGMQQLVAIAKALSRNAKLLILDEPTSSLSEEESQRLLNLIRDLKSQGMTCILISHRLKEVIEIADKVTVLRDGQTICTLDAKNDEISEGILIKHMIGRELNNVYPPREHTPSEEITLEVKNWTVYDPKKGKNILRDINFYVRKGEIVGFAGLIGAGRTELALSLFGNPRGYKISGDLFIHGKKRIFNLPEEAINSGMAYLSEDRKGEGLILIQSIRENITIANLKALTKYGVIDANKETQVATEHKNKLSIKAKSIEQKAENLSGGNQQKVCFSKWLFVDPDILILDEPTRGIDVGAKYEIYTIIDTLARQGKSITMISSELPEILGMCDRIYVVSSGQITGEMLGREATQEKIMQLAID